VTRVLLGSVMAMTLADLAAAGQRRLTLSEAERLARAALSEETTRLAGFSLEPPPIPPKKGAMFNIIWAEPAPGSASVPSIVVDIETGEVWDPMQCERITTPNVVAIQRSIRRQLSIAAIDVNRAQALTRGAGCSNLIDERPREADFALALMAGVSTNEKKTLYRYLLAVDDVQYIGVSPVPISIREGTKVKFLKTRSSMYVIDDGGAIQELHDELHFAPPPPPK
jgi:hypothetical protein